ncbi:hypothetical protein C0Q70_20415 [Pomacea canaliculata]|uniref:Uncharacterized protein n=1 Tax=Pomacea canaliculata TaxID=400727 RepID=A0A2T7NFI0_POMCA|nr:hypothetical protein C0Q70_20415 [Pomacea canaliculata]
MHSVRVWVWGVGGENCSENGKRVFPPKVEWAGEMGVARGAMVLRGWKKGVEWRWEWVEGRERTQQSRAFAENGGRGATARHASNSVRSRCGTAGAVCRAAAAAACYCVLRIAEERCSTRRGALEDKAATSVHRGNVCSVDVLQTKLTQCVLYAFRKLSKQKASLFSPSVQLTFFDVRALVWLFTRWRCSEKVKRPFTVFCQVSAAALRRCLTAAEGKAQGMVVRLRISTYPPGFNNAPGFLFAVWLRPV